MRIVTWNIHCFNAQQEKTLGYLINTIKPDVALLQEAKSEIEAVSKLHGYNIFGHSIGGKRNWGSYVAIKNTIDAEPLVLSVDPGWIVGVTFSNIRSKPVHAISLHTRLKDREERPFDYVIPHLYSVFDNLEPIITNKIDCIIGGDFNADVMFDRKENHPEGKAHTPFFDHLEKDLGLVNCTKQCLPQKRTQTFFKGKSDNSGIQDDYVFVSANLKDNIMCHVPDRDSILTTLSDHLPIVVDVSF